MKTIFKYAACGIGAVVVICGGAYGIKQIVDKKKDEGGNSTEE